MHFCSCCQNMYYISLSEKEANKLVYYCRNCGNIDTMVQTEGHCVLDTQYKKGEQKFYHMINKYTKMDPTLPRIYNMKCPNATCPTNTISDSDNSNKNKTEIVYMRYDDNNLKYIYLCVTCDTVWKTNDNK